LATVLTQSLIVEKNFSRNPDYYHKNAETQRYAADTLAEIIQQKNSDKIDKILEIGCGTGFLTEKLFLMFPQAAFTITDISGSMLQFCGQQTQTLRSKQNVSANFTINDIVESFPEGKYDLIVSSMAFQWIDDLSAILQQVQNHLSKNGILVFSTLSQDTFSSVKRIFNDLGILFPGPQLLTTEKINSACRHFTNLEVKNELCIEEFDTMLKFLRHIQSTGAGNASGNSMSARDLKKVLRNQFGKKIQAEYNITYAVCK